MDKAYIKQLESTVENLSDKLARLEALEVWQTERRLNRLYFEYRMQFSDGGIVKNIGVSRETIRVALLHKTKQSALESIKLATNISANSDILTIYFISLRRNSSKYHHTFRVCADISTKVVYSLYKDEKSRCVTQK